MAVLMNIETPAGIILPLHCNCASPISEFAFDSMIHR